MPALSSIDELLQQQTTNLGRLLSLIDSEKQALLDRNADELLTLAKDKHDLLEQLKQLDQSLGQHPQRSRLKQPPLNAQVQQAQQLLADCQQKNLENGKLIELCAASINRLAQALQMSRNANSLTYDGKGKTSTIATLGNDLKA